VTAYELNGPVIEYRCGGGFSALVQTDPEARPVSYTMDTGSFPRVKPLELSVDHPAHLALRERVELYPYSPLWASIACFGVKFASTTVVHESRAPGHRCD